VPIGAEEFFEAQAFYPIVFTATEPIIPVAVLWLEAERNLFVEADGKWQSQTYIPANMRRYPFVFTTAAEDKLVLGVDEGASSFSRTGGQGLFKGNEPSAMTKRALEFCSVFQVQDRIAREFAPALKAKDLLASQQANIQGGPGRPVKSLTRFRVIEEARLAALPDDVIWTGASAIGSGLSTRISCRSNGGPISPIYSGSPVPADCSAMPDHCGLYCLSTEDLDRGRRHRGGEIKAKYRGDRSSEQDYCRGLGSHLLSR
jgi:hypothetical protein